MILALLFEVCTIVDSAPDSASLWSGNDNKHISAISPVGIRSLSSRAALTSQIDTTNIGVYLVCRSQVFAKNARMKTINAEVAELMYHCQVSDQLQDLSIPIQ